MERANTDWFIEFKLLLIAALSLIGGLSAVCLSAGTFNAEAIGVAVFIIMVAFAASYVNRFKLYRGDPLLFPLAVFLSGIGLIMIFRLEPKLFLMQALWLIIGITTFTGAGLLFRKIDQIADYKYICGTISIILLLATIIFGVNINGHISWITFHYFSIQPTEIAKLFVIFFLASYLSERSELLMFANNHYGRIEVPPLRFVAPLVCLWGLTMILLIIQRDLGAALLYFGITIGMIYLASSRLYYVIIGVVLFLIGSIICYKYYGHVQIRVDMWLNPWQDPSDKGFQIVQSLFAFGSGGILGSGLTFGHPKMIPEEHTDFIFAAIGEELGFVGAAAVLINYIIAVYRAFRIALLASNRFRRLAAGGVGIFLSLQLFLIIGGVTKFFPLTGITLPFISYGGSSMVSDYIIFAVLYAVSEVKLYEKAA